MSIRKRLKGGFTLVELMIVVAIVGILAVLAIYGVRRYITNAKTAEARNALGQIGKDAVSAYEGERMAAAILAPGASTAVLRAMCAQGTVKKVPDTVPKGMKYQSSKVEWSDPADVGANKGWPCLKYEMSSPQYYSYEYLVAGSNAENDTFTAKAYGDLDGNDTKSTFTMGGKIQQLRLTLSPSINEESPEE